MDECLSYVERMKKIEKINLEINIDCFRREKLRKMIREEDFVDVKQKWKYNREQKLLKKIIDNLKEKLIVMGIPVPELGGFEIENGLPNMKRDINLKLVGFLNDDKVRQVYFLFYLFFYFF
jgi:hypothetical protein